MNLQILSLCKSPYGKKNLIRSSKVLGHGLMKIGNGMPDADYWNLGAERLKNHIFKGTIVERKMIHLGYGRPMRLLTASFPGEGLTYRIFQFLLNSL